MDRLVCGDVGFGKTEVALRAAFVVRHERQAGRRGGADDAARPPALQDLHRALPRFSGQGRAGLAAGHLRRISPQTKKGLADGTVDIVVGTHALLGKAIKFKDLGLIMVDEEQHFGVAHKERLKNLRAEVHVLTLTATPIPRTLQLALTGVRELSIIASPPVDRLAVRTFVTPFDPADRARGAVARALSRRPGFYVCPRIEDLGEAKDFLDKHVPEARVVRRARPDAAGRARGRHVGLLRRQVRRPVVDHHHRVRARHPDRQHARSMHRADMFGLAQLYQLRGRVGRSKTRAYALFTLPAARKITPQAERRLKVLQSLDSLGAGFQLASHDLDIRGAGNLLGEEQSGHIKEVGFELYQQMLEEAVASAQVRERPSRWPTAGRRRSPSGRRCSSPRTTSPTCRCGSRSIAGSPRSRTSATSTRFAAEMVDRFGKLSGLRCSHLLDTVVLKTLCRRANVAKIEAGPKGAVLSFRDDSFANPEGLVAFIREQGPAARVRPDMKVVLFDDWETPEERLKGTTTILRRLVKIAERAKAA